MHTPRVTIVGHRWDNACGELRQFLARNQITFDWMPLDSPDLPRRWPGLRPADEDCPVLKLADGTILTRPATRSLAERLGLQTCASHAKYDTVVVGGGPAGLAAAVYGASEGLRTLVIEREAPGGQAGTSSRIENYLGFPSGVSGDELASRALKQAGRLGAGTGSCFVEFGDGRIGWVDLDFLTGPKPTSTYHAPSLAQRADKVQFGASRRARWFGL